MRIAWFLRIKQETKAPRVSELGLALELAARVDWPYQRRELQAGGTRVLMRLDSSSKKNKNYFQWRVEMDLGSDWKLAPP